MLDVFHGVNSVITRSPGGAKLRRSKRGTWESGLSGYRDDTVTLHDVGVVRKGPVYLDHHATTPVDPRVAEAVFGAMCGPYGNPQSTEHSFGAAAARAVDDARAAVGVLVGAEGEDVHFTSGSTESLRLAIAAAACSTRKALRILMPRTEHAALIDAAERMQREGRAEIVWLDVDGAGRIGVGEVARNVQAGDLLCLMAANNEVGTIHPVEEAAAAAHRAGARILVDATQAAGRIAIRAVDWDLDFLVFNAHKIYGPKGVGALIGSDATLAFGDGALAPSGTPNVPAIIGFGAACRLRQAEGPDDERRIAGLRDRLERLLADRLPSMVVNGDKGNRLAHNLSICLPGVANDAVLARLRDRVAISSGSACRSGAQTPSHVLRAMGIPDDLLDGALRISPGKFTVIEEIDFAADAISDAVLAVQSGCGAC